MPKPELTSRVIANELPPTTYSPTAFDMPLRKDVIQTQIPSSVTRTFETSSDPRFPPKKAVSTVHGVLYHGTSSTDPKVIHGIETNFFEKSSKKKNLKNKKSKKSKKDFDLHSSLRAKEAALHYAKNAFEGSDAVLNSISSSITPSPHYILDANVLNKKEQPDFRMHEDNHNLKRRLEELKRTPAGVRAAHTLRRLG